MILKNRIAKLMACIMMLACIFVSSVAPASAKTTYYYYGNAEQGVERIFLSKVDAVKLRTFVATDPNVNVSDPPRMKNCRFTYYLSSREKTPYDVSREG